MQNQCAPEIEFEKLSRLSELFHERFHHRPTSFRAGRFGLSAHTLDFLSLLNYKTDSSVAPFMHGKDQIHFFGAPTQPYYPAHSDYLVQGDLDIVEIPITIGNPLWERMPGLSKTVPKYPLFWGTVRKHLHLEQFFRSTWLRPTFSTTQEMKKLIQRFSRAAKNIDIYSSVRLSQKTRLN